MMDNNLHEQKRRHKGVDLFLKLYRKHAFLCLRGFILFFIIACTNEGDKLTFSKTQKWEAKALKSASNEYLVFPMNQWEKILKVSPPPSEKAFIKKEIDYLLNLEKNRNINDIKKIKEEESFINNGKYGLKKKPLNSKKYKVLLRLLNLAYIELETVILHHKKKFDRARPSFYDQRLKPAIENPKHPSYPSAYAAKAYMMAEILTIVNPKGKKKYLKYARDIAFHRELAGIQYPSDTVAGRVLGVNFARVLINREDFKAFFKVIKDERKKQKK